jgi:ketosteroid isomerase-like protein
MRKRIFFVTTLLILFAVTLPAEPEDAGDIRAAIKTFTAAANALDLKRTISCYANKPDVSVFNPGPNGPAVGLAAVRKDWAGFFALLTSMHSELSDIAVQSDGKFAFAYFTTTEEIVMKDGTRIKPLFRATTIYQKIDGHWLIIHEHKSEPREK